MKSSATTLFENLGKNIIKEERITSGAIFWISSYLTEVTPFMDKMTKWLRRWTVNPLVSARVGSNPIFVVFLIGSTVKWIAICSLNIFIRVQISEKTGNLKS